MGQLRTAQTYETQIVSLAKVLQILQEEQNPDVLIEATLNYIKQAFDYRLIWIGLYERLENRLQGKGGFVPDNDNKVLRQKSPIHSGDLMEQMVIQQRSIVIPDLRKETRAGEWQKVAQKFEIQGTLLFPLCHRKQCFGVVLLGSHLWGVSPRAGDKAQLEILIRALAMALSQIEIEQQSASAQPLHEPLFQALEELQGRATLNQKLEQVIGVIQDFINPTRTNLYWYSLEKRFFWHRLGNKKPARFARDFPTSSGIPAKDVYDFYRLLTGGQLVTIGVGQSPFSSESTHSVLSQLNARSIVAAPILVHEELVGFLAVEEKAARIWEDSELSFIQATAQAIALVVGTEEVGTKLEQVKADAQFIAEVTQAFAGNSEEKTPLDEYAKLLCQRFGITGVWILQAQQALLGDLLTTVSSAPIIPYLNFYHYSSAKRRTHTGNELLLTSADWQSLRKFGQITVIDDVQKDLHLTGSKTKLLEMGVRSLLFCPVDKETCSEFLVLTHPDPRTWTSTELRLVSALAPQIQWVLRLNTQQKQENETQPQNPPAPSGEPVAKNGEDISPYMLLHWYKHRALEILHHSIIESVGVQEGHQQLKQAILAFTPLLKQEKRQLKVNFTSVAILPLLKRSLHLFDEIIQQRQLKTHWYSPGQFSIESDRLKLECVLYELLGITCHRAPHGSSIALWCRPLPDHRNPQQLSWLEVAIVEHPASLSQEAARIPPWQVSASPIPAETTHTKICQQVLHPLRGKLRFYHLKDGRHLIRLVLPLASNP